MSLLQDSSYDQNKNKKLFMFGGIALIVLIFIIVALLAMVTALGGSKISLVVNNKKCNSKDYLISKEIDGNNVVYIDVENIVKTLAGEYAYGSGNKDVEDDNQCYVTNSIVQESTFLKVGSKEYYKILEETNEIEYYKLEHEIIKENNKIYIPIDACEIALNVRCLVNNNQYNLTSIGFFMNSYNQSTTKTFIADESVEWDTSCANKKLLKYGLVIIKDNLGQYGVGNISTSYNSKTKVTTVTTTQLVTPKHTYIQYNERYNQLVVENKDGRGIVQLNRDDNGNVTKETIISPQYADIIAINNDLYLVSREFDNEEKQSDSSSSEKKSVKYGIIDKQNNTILKCEYDQIGVDTSKFTNNNLNNNYIIYDAIIPVKKDNLWGLVNLKGSQIAANQFTSLGCTESNSSSNVLIIPEIDGIVVKKNNKYGVITKAGKSKIDYLFTRVYKEQEDNKNNYYVIYNGTNKNIKEFVDNSKNQNNSGTTKPTTTDNKNNSTTTKPTTENKK